jgi:hypothetical protein
MTGETDLRETVRENVKLVALVQDRVSVRHLEIGH